MTGSVNKWRAVNIVYLDFSKTFDTVSHNILIHKLMKSGLGKDSKADGKLAELITGSKSCSWGQSPAVHPKRWFWGQLRRCVTCSLMTWMTRQNTPQQLCRWHKTGRSGWYTRMGVLPFRSTSTGWTNRQTGPFWSSRKVSATSWIWAEVIPWGTDWGPTVWKG